MDSLTARERRLLGELARCFDTHQNLCRRLKFDFDASCLSSAIRNYLFESPAPQDEGDTQSELAEYPPANEYLKQQFREHGSAPERAPPPERRIPRWIDYFGAEHAELMTKERAAGFAAGVQAAAHVVRRLKNDLPSERSIAERLAWDALYRALTEICTLSPAAAPDPLPCPVIGQVVGEPFRACRRMPGEGKRGFCCDVEAARRAAEGEL